MIIDEDKKRIESINRMIIELSSGNFSYSINRSEKDDELETSVMLLNMMAEEIREYFRHKDFVNAKDSCQYAAQMNLLLDREFKIKNFSPNTKEILLLDPDEILNIPLSSLLTASSQIEWKRTIDNIPNLKTSNIHLELLFQSENNLSLPLACSLTKLEPPKNDLRFCLTAFQTVAQNKQLENKFYNTVKRTKRINESAKKVKTLKRESDIRKIKEVYQYILENLDEPLLSLKELAHSVGTNEFKLKIGFRQLYNTSVFRFQTEERLKKAHLLIRNTDMALKTIADKTGFKSFPHFSKTFKKRFGYNPSDLQKQSREERL